MKILAITIRPECEIQSLHLDVNKNQICQYISSICRDFMSL